MSGETNWWDGYNRLDLNSDAFTEWAREVVPDLLHEVDSLRLALGVHTRTVTDLREELRGLTEAGSDGLWAERSRMQAKLAAQEPVITAALAACRACDEGEVGRTFSALSEAVAAYRQVRRETEAAAGWGEVERACEVMHDAYEKWQRTGHVQREPETADGWCAVNIIDGMEFYPCNKQRPCPEHDLGVTDA